MVWTTTSASHSFSDSGLWSSAPVAAGAASPSSCGLGSPSAVAPSGASSSFGPAPSPSCGAAAGASSSCGGAGASSSCAAAAVGAGASSSCAAAAGGSLHNHRLVAVFVGPISALHELISCLLVRVGSALLLGLGSRTGWGGTARTSLFLWLVWDWDRLLRCWI